MKARTVKGLDPLGPLGESAARIIATRLDELRSFAPAALEADAAPEQHDMRIAAKRLRYVLEITGELFGPPADRARRKAKDLQGILGDLHDCDVMLPRIEERIAALRHVDAQAVRRRAGESDDLDAKLSGDAPNRTSYRGLAILAVHVEARRILLFERFAGLWAHADRTWTDLEDALERGPRSRITGVAAG